MVRHGLVFWVVIPLVCGRGLAQTAPGQYPAKLDAGSLRLDFETVRDVVYKQQDGESLLADVYEPRGKGPFAAVLLVHGGAWTSGNKSQLDGIAMLLAASRYAVVAINYRLAPKYKFPAQLEDCRDALLWMRQHATQYKIDPTRLAAWGYSAGGHLVTLLGVTTPDLAAVVAGGTPCDFQNMPPDNPYLAFWLGDTRRNSPDVYKEASPARFVSADDPPIFFYHGENDRLVPLAQPKAMVAELRKVGVPAEMHTVEGAGHIAALANREAAFAAKRFLDRRLHNGNADR